MKIQIQTPQGGWFYVKNSQGGLVWGIYDIDTLEGEENLAKCREAYPTLNFRLAK